MSTSWKMAALCGLLVCFAGTPVLAQPANDNCVDAISVTENVATPWTTLDSTDEGTFTCRGLDDVWFEWTATLTGNVQVVLSNVAPASGTSTDTNHSVYINSVPGSCPTDADNVGCFDPFSGSFSAVSGQSYLIRIGRWSNFTANEFTGDLTVLTPSPEICDDGVDNDFDGDTDCADVADCSAFPACAPPANDDCSGAIALADGVLTAFTTENAGDDGTLACRGSSDVWYEYTPSANGTLDVIISGQTDLGGGFWDTNHSLYLNPGAGACPTDADNVACSDSTNMTGVPVTGGQSYLIRIGTWSSTSGEEGLGDVTATLTIAVPEICDNGIDDDADGLTDCADTADCGALPECIEAGNCDDGIDNDADGATDCDDVADCGLEPQCLPPANDNCVDAIAVGEGVTLYDNTNATDDGPDDCDGNMSGDVWFLYTATTGGTATISLCNGATGTMTDSTLIVYDGAACPVAGDAGIACDDDSCPSASSTSAFMSEVEIPVCAGESYYVQVGGWNGSQGSGELNISVAAPSNDDCANATPVGEGTIEFSNCGATLDGPTDGDGNMDLDVWFLYTAGGDGVAVINTCATEATLDDTVIIVYDGAACPTAGDTGLVSDDDTCAPGGVGSAFNSEVSLAVTAGSTYLIQIGGWNGGVEGSASLSISLPEVCNDGIDNDADGDTDCLDSDCVAEAFCIEAGNCGDGIDNDLDGLTDCADTVDCDPLTETLCDGLPPANDNCVDAIAVGEGSFLVDNQDATDDGPTDCDSNMSTDVWYLYTASLTGTATITTCGEGPGTLTDTTLIVYDGAVCPIGGDPFIACDDDSCSLGSASAFASIVEIEVTAGSTYLVQVGGWNGSTGVGELNIDVVIPGDDCADPILVGEGSFDFSNVGATDVGPDECDPGSNTGTDVWFLYTPTLSGDATINTCTTTGSLTDTVLTVYDGATGCPVPGDVALACDDDSCAAGGVGSAFASEVVVPVTLGNTYYIQVGGWNGSEGDGTLLIDTVLPCVDPTPDFSAGPALSGIAPLSVDFLNLSDDGGDPATTYDWDFGDLGTSGDANPSHTYTDCGLYSVTLTANGCGVSVPTTQADLIQVYAMGDTNGDCLVDVADAVATANYLFGGGAAPVCGNAADVNGDGVVDIADPVYLLIFLFGGGAAPVAPAGSGC